MQQSNVERLRSNVKKPIHDEINVVKKYESIQKSDMPSDLKTRALSFLQLSYENEKRMIENWEKKNNQKWQYP